MKKIDVATTVMKSLFEPILGKISVKTYFSYYGVFKSNIMFGLYREGDFFLRTTENTHHIIQSIQDTYNLAVNARLQTKRHYYIPDNYLHSAEFCSLVKKVVTDLENEANLLEQNQKCFIRNQPNANMNFERLLQRQGIQDMEALRSLGEVNTFVLLLERGEDVSSSVLFRLYGVIHRKHIDLIPLSEKIRLLKEVDDVLYAKGLKQRFQSECEHLIRQNNL